MYSGGIVGKIWAALRLPRSPSQKYVVTVLAISSSTQATGKCGWNAAWRGPEFLPSVGETSHEALAKLRSAYSSALAAYRAAAAARAHRSSTTARH